MSEIEASELSKMAISYRRAEGKAERNALFLKIERHYFPLVSKKIPDIKFDLRDDYLQIYRLEILRALKNWNLKSNFETYLFPYIRGVYPKFVNSIKMFRDEIKTVTFSDVAENVVSAIAYNKNLFEEGPKMPNVNVRTETLARFNRARKANNSDEFLNQLLDAAEGKKADAPNLENEKAGHLTEADFMKLKKDDLKKIAGDNEIEVKTGDSKEMIVHAIIDSEKYAAGSLIVEIGGDDGDN